MRLAYVCMDPGVPVFGRKGCSVHCQEVIRAFLKRGFDVELIATRIGEDVPSDLKNIRIHRLAKKIAKLPADREAAVTALNSAVSTTLENTGPLIWSMSDFPFGVSRQCNSRAVNVYQESWRLTRP